MAYPKWINQDRIFIRVNKKEQEQKRTRIGKIIVDHKNAFMRFNLQYGQVVLFGKKVRQTFPEMEVGDDILFHHFIEGSLQHFDNESQRDSNNEYLFHEDETYNYYLFRVHLAYGIIKPDGRIITSPQYAFGRPYVTEKDSREEVLVNGLYLFSNYKETTELVLQRIEQYKEIAEHSTAMNVRAHYFQMMEEATAELNKNRYALFEPLYWHPSLLENVKVPERFLLYYAVRGSDAIELESNTVDYKGQTFSMLNTNLIVAIQNMVEEKTMAISGKDYITTLNAPKLYIPDSSR